MKIIKIKKLKQKINHLRVNQIIQLVDGVESYNILEELKNTPAHITLAQLLNISSLLRSDVTKSFRKSKGDDEIIVGLADSYNTLTDLEIVNNPSHDYNSKNVQEHDITVVKGFVNGATAAVLIDGCSNANLVTRNFLNNSIKNYKIVGSVTSKVHQAMSDAEERVYEIVQLDVNIGNLTISSNFRISEKEDSFYDIIIGLKTQHDHKIIVDTVDKYLSIKNKENKLVPLVPIEDINISFTSLIMLFI